MQARTIAATALILCASLLASAADDKTPAGTPTAVPTKDAKRDADAKGVKPAGPRLEMGKDHPKNGGKERDMRHCLDLPDAKAVIRCYEKK